MPSRTKASRSEIKFPGTVLHAVKFLSDIMHSLQWRQSHAHASFYLTNAGEEDDVVQASDLDQVLEHRVPGVHRGAGRGVRGAGDDDPDAGEGAQEEVPPARRLRPQAGQARRAGPWRAETGTDGRTL